MLRPPRLLGCPCDSARYDLRNLPPLSPLGSLQLHGPPQSSGPQRRLGVGETFPPAVPNLALSEKASWSTQLLSHFPSLSPQAASSALSSLGHVYTAIGDYPNALASHKQCVLLAKQSKDELSEARELGNMGAVYIAMGDFENAVQCHEQHLGIAKAMGNQREEARAYSNLGSAYHYRRNFDKAMSYHNHVLELAQELAEKAIEMRAYAGLGHAARCMQDLERAKQYHEEQLRIAESLQDRAAEGRASSNLGKALPAVDVGPRVLGQEGAACKLCSPAADLCFAARGAPGPGPGRADLPSPCKE